MSGIFFDISLYSISHIYVCFSNPLGGAHSAHRDICNSLLKSLKGKKLTAMSFTEKGEFSCMKLFVIQSFGWYVFTLFASDGGFTEEFFPNLGSSMHSWLYGLNFLHIHSLSLVSL